MYFPLPDSGQDSERLFHFSITHAHTSQLGVCGWGFLRLSDRQKEEGKKVENIGQKDIQAIVVNGVIIADIVQLCYCLRWGSTKVKGRDSENEMGLRTLLDDGLI
jgi:hypothetical protein